MLNDASPHALIQAMGAFVMPGGGRDVINLNVLAAPRGRMLPDRGGPRHDRRCGLRCDDLAGRAVIVAISGQLISVSIDDEVVEYHPTRTLELVRATVELYRQALVDVEVVE